MRWIAHSGLAGTPGGAPTAASLGRAAALGVVMIEVDVRLTADGRLVLRHDPGLASGATVEARDLAGLRAEQAVLTLDEAAEAVAGRVPLLLDLKGPAVAAPLAGWLGRRRDPAAFAVCTDDPVALASLRAAAPEVARWRTLPRVGEGPGERRRRIVACALRSRLPAQLDRLAAEVGAAGVSVDRWAVTRALCAAASSLSLGLTAWTVNRPRDALAMARLGVECCTSDRVEELLAALPG